MLALRRTPGVLRHVGSRPTRLAPPFLPQARPIGHRVARSHPPPRAQPPASDTADLLSTLKAVTRTPAYRGPLQIAVFLVVFMVFDAAWSGDWSRIGAISKETEASLKPVSLAIVAVHLASAGVAWRAVSGRGGEPLVPVAKALAVGVLAAVEAMWDED